MIRKPTQSPKENHSKPRASGDDPYAAEIPTAVSV